MLKKFKTIICYLLTFAMLMTLLPPQAYEASISMENVSGQENHNDGLQAPYADNQEGLALGETVSLDNTSLEDAEIVMELTDRRTEYSKEYKLDNGLNLAVVYSEPVHYKENEKWEEIDNTLKAQGSGASASYKNTAGSWQIEFPQQMDEESKVKITKDGYAVSFIMSGELCLDTAMKELRASVETSKVSKAKKSQGKVHKYDYSKVKEQAQHPEAIRDKLRSRMSYSDVYNNTDVIYDLDPQQLKESIVINAYDPSVYGYVYTLDTGKLVPVLNEDGRVDLLTKNKGEVVMTMPAPFMIDNEGTICTDVSVTLEKVKGTYQLTYLLPMEWVADENRAWPVILDPVVKPGTKTSNILDHFVAENYSASKSHGYLYAGHHATYGDMRTYIKFSAIPDLTAADIVKNAKLKLDYAGGSSGSTIIEAHQVTGAWETGTITWSGQPSWNTTIADYCSVGSAAEYSWDITDIVYSWYVGENNGVMLKGTSSIENSSTANWKQFYSVDYNKTNTSYWPYLEITYETETGIEDYWDYTTTSAGRAGNGYINNTTGNLTWIHSDLGFDGNLMPVSISHIYTLAERNETKYGLGKGWRTNFHQTVALSDSGDYYIWTDGDGTKHHFNKKSTNTYVDEDGLRLTLTVSSGSYTITDIYGNTSNFDSYGRLTSMVNNQTTKSKITITYSGTTNRITQITDGANRVYKFTYENNLLSQISFHGKGGLSQEEIPYVNFAYSSSKLITVTYADGLDSHFTYDGTKLLTATDVDGYKVKFGYSTGITKRAVSIEEFDGTKAGNKITIEFAYNKAKISDNQHTVIHHYNDYGNLISTQDDQGNGQFYQYTENKHVETPTRKNQLSQASKQQNTVVNLSNHGSFEIENVSEWNATSRANSAITTEKAYIGTHAFRVTLSSISEAISAYGAAITVLDGKTCTFSAYLQSVVSSVQLGLGTTSSAYVRSDVQDTSSGWKRLEVSYTNTTGSSITIYPLLILSTAGNAYMDCVQIELTGGTSRYNIVQNGDFRTTGYWTSSAGRTTLSTSAAPQLSTNVYKMTGSPTSSQSIYQTIPVKGSAGDAFVLSGWAKGNSVPLSNTSRQFGLKITFNHTDGSTNTALVSFNSAYDAANDWQYTAGRVEATEAYSSVKVELVYSYNMNTVYFDGIQLYKEEFGERYEYDTNGNLTKVIDVLGLTTTYQYTNNDLTKVVEASGITTENRYVNHNLTWSQKSYKEDGRTVYLGSDAYSYDAYGNQTRAGSVRDEVYKETIASYSDDYNNLATTTDELGNVTTYEYDPDTSMLLSVKYPKDTDATKTKYVYDKMFHLKSTTAKTDKGEEMSVDYSYDPDSNGKSRSDRLTQIATQSSVYNFIYGDFSLRTKVAVGTKTLATYTYTNDVYHRLASVTYGNGDKVEYTYDDLGRVTKELYIESGSTAASRTVSYVYDSMGALATVADSKTGITTTYYYDTIGRNTGIREIGGSSSHRFDYTYDGMGRVQTFREIYGGTKYYTYYTYNGNGQVSKVDAGNSTETLKQIIGQTTTQKTTTYVYDSANQLIRENNQAAGKTWVWTYDGAGNILTETEYAYTTGTPGTPQAVRTYGYGDTNWGDLLKTYNGKSITYDSIGNPLSDGTWTYTWQEGRKLATMSKSGTTWSFIYDANGMRTKRTTGSTTYNYTYHGSQLTHMTYGSNVLHFYYDASGRPLSVVYNNLTYYYVLNLQGDVVALLDSSGNQVVGYRYDAWGRLLATTGSKASTLGLHNPLRYRGYVYDWETGLYYLESRYYNPEIGRFINADSYISTGTGILGFNMFAYCNNNPIRFVDFSGEFLEDADPTDDFLEEGAGGGGRVVYHYGVDFSFAGRSSLFHGGLYNCGYSTYSYTTPARGNGVTTAGRAIQKVGTTTEGGSKADILAKNRAVGIAFEQQEFAKFSSKYSNAVEQITLKTPSGFRTRVDAIGLDANGKIVINEFKSSLTAPLTYNQKSAFPEIFSSGAIVVGNGKGIFGRGYPIPAGTEVIVIRP